MLFYWTSLTKINKHRGFKGYRAEVGNNTWQKSWTSLFPIRYQTSFKYDFTYQISINANATKWDLEVSMDTDADYARTRMVSGVFCGQSTCGDVHGTMNRDDNADRQQGNEKNGVKKK